MYHYLFLILSFFIIMELHFFTNNLNYLLILTLFVIFFLIHQCFVFSIRVSDF